METLSLIADVVSILSAIFALAAWLQARQLHQQIVQEQTRQNKKVTVKLQHGADALELPVEMRRAELTRAEILGRLGMIPMKKKGARFAIAYLNTTDFLRQINQIMTNTGDALLTIPCEQDEFEQFDVKR